LARKPTRGLSAGTIVMIGISLLSLLVSGFVFLRVSGDIGDVQFSPGLLAEPLMGLANAPAATQPPIPTAPPMQQSFAIAATPTSSPAPQPTAPQTRTLTLTAVGQIGLGTELRGSGWDEASETYLYTPIFEGVRHALSGGDIAIATLRTGLGAQGASFDTYHAPAALASALKDAGVNLINLGTDRALDHGIAGVGETLTVLEALGIASVGATRAAQTPALSEVQGIKVGVLSYTESVSSAGRNAASEGERSAALRLLDAESAAQDIAALRAQGAQVVIVLAHWGSRSAKSPDRDIRAMAQALADAGADVILGTNPTRVQALERLTATDAQGQPREVFVAYSLGNFLSDETRETADITGLVLRLSIEWNPLTERITFADAWYMPTWIMRWRDETGAQRYRLIPSDVSEIPGNMSDSIYINMQKSFQNVINALGTEAARPYGR
jgi:poly-gamma-glutamate synthesis protein (capsule biosynthesis protein)